MILKVMSHDFKKFTNQTTAHILHMNTCITYSYIHIMIYSIYTEYYTDPSLSLSVHVGINKSHA